MATNDKAGLWWRLPVAGLVGDLVGSLVLAIWEAGGRSGPATAHATASFFAFVAFFTFLIAGMYVLVCTVVILLPLALAMRGAIERRPMLAGSALTFAAGLGGMIFLLLFPDMWRSHADRGLLLVSLLFSLPAGATLAVVLRRRSPDRP